MFLTLIILTFLLIYSKKRFGDLSTNIAMIDVIFKDFSYGVKKDRLIFNKTIKIKKVDIINPGFINIFFILFGKTISQRFKYKRKFNYRIKSKKYVLNMSVQTHRLNAYWSCKRRRFR